MPDAIVPMPTLQFNPLPELPKDSRLEKEYQEDYQKWRQRPTPAMNAHMLDRIRPVLNKAIRAHVGKPNALLITHAKRLGLQALRSYDPRKAKLQTHLFNQLQGLKRIARRQQEVLHVPERFGLERGHMLTQKQELQDEIGREPTMEELADRTGLSRRRLMKLQGFQPAMAEGSLGRFAEPGEGPMIPAVEQEPSTGWQSLVYDDVGPIDKKIMEWTLGLDGQPVLSNTDIARKLHLTPPAVTQRKARIQQLLDREQELSPFG